MNDLQQLAALLKERDAIDERISRLIGRPSYSGHIGEFVASRIFDIALHASATHKASDGVFASGLLAGKSVNIKYYARMQPLLDMAKSIDLADHCDYYLVMTGPRGSVASSRNTVYSWSIAAVYLFDSRALVAEQVRRNVKLGVASSVPNQLWDAAMLFPSQNNEVLPLIESQIRMLELFASGRQSV